METPIIETYRTSPAGIRFERNQTIALIGGVIVGSGVFALWPGANLLDPAMPISMIAFLVLLEFFGASQEKIEVLVEPHHIQLRKDGMSRRIPVATLRRIKITRSARGDHRHIRIWDDNNDAVLLLDPENGAALERWAGELARSHGVPLTITHPTLMGYTVWGAFGAGMLMVYVAEWITALITA